MSRRNRATKRYITPDAVYQSVIVAKFINKVMKCGKKSTAESIVYRALATIEERESRDPATVLEQAVKNKPSPVHNVRPLSLPCQVKGAFLGVFRCPGSHPSAHKYK